MKAHLGKKNVLNFSSSTEQDCLKITLHYKDLQFDYMIKLEKDAEFLWHMAIGPRFMVISQSSTINGNI